MKLSKQELVDIFDDASDFNGSNEQAIDAYKALKNGTLEIEGYECVQWIKFDPNDESTFPPRNGKRIMIAYEQSNNSDKWEVMIEPSTNYLIRFLRTDFSNLNVCWRPLQLPPIEKERSKNDSK